jgi:hypothetical protein
MATAGGLMQEVAIDEHEVGCFVRVDTGNDDTLCWAVAQRAKMPPF